jgi:hypothetical protein
MKCKVNIDELKKFKQGLDKMNEAQRVRWTETAIKDLAQLLLEKVTKRTPVGTYPSGSGKTGGTLRRNWKVGEVVKTGDRYTIELANLTEYAPYVEFGHRGVYVPALGKTLHKDTRWTEGKFMLTISETELQADAPGFLMKRLKKFMEGAFA